MRTVKGRRAHGPRSLRGKLTLANVVLLALSIVAATAASLMGLRHYLLDAIDSELLSSRRSVGEAPLTFEQIDSLTALFALSEKMGSGSSGDDTDTLVQGSVFVAVDAAGRPLAIGGLPVTGTQRALAAAVADPAPLVADTEPRDLQVRGDHYRVTAGRLDDGTTVLLATSTEPVSHVVAKALKLDLAVGSLLLALLACLTMISVRRRTQPLEDMVETSTAIAEGDLTRRVPSSREPTLEVEQLRLALNSMLHQVESAYRTRERSAAQLRRFVADASHELRTPLSAIRGYLQLYDKGMLRDPVDRKRAWERVMAEADRMGRLVDELLVLARLDQQPQLRFRDVDLSLLVREAAQDLRAQQPERPLTVAADGALLVHADESGLRQILGNLLANVRIHTPSDVPVRLAAQRRDGTVRLCVADDGPGLDAEDAARVFDRFFRAGGGAGSGLGMAIVQGVVHAHGGEVAVETAPGEGLAVTVTLPDRPAPAPEDCAGVPPPDAAAPSRPS
ncbi:ATP-binding protein [Streptomyces cadmiisoli]|uniref:sensor histidine kinase n=1 Tax=Streptomyces cadmiisoli TaxID=2184053 RepID=UPI003D7235E8